jgi:endonuclease/exonuclease/phosphatase family metal-dependent hydrolase
MSAEQITFATCNLHNLQLPGRPMYRGETYSPEAFDAKIGWTAHMLRSINADIIGFQELWSPAALVEAFDIAGLLSDYHLVTVDQENPGQISVALAVKKKNAILFKRWHKYFPEELVLKKRLDLQDHTPDYEISVSIDRFSRDVLRVTINLDPPGGNPLPNLVVFVAHLKSKMAMSLDRQEREQRLIRTHSKALGAALSTIRRTAEAAALRVLLNKVMKKTDTPVVVLGDLNDAQLSVTTSIITGEPKYRLFAASGTGQRSDKGLYSAATLQEYRSLRDVYYTYIHDGQRESLDHILVSEQFYDYSRRRIWTFRGMRMFNDFLGDVDDATSDHALIAATFDYQPAR